MSAERQAGVRLWAKACKSEEGRAVSLSARSSRWLGRPKGPTVVTGSEEAAVSAGGLLACCCSRSSLHPHPHSFSGPPPINNPQHRLLPLPAVLNSSEKAKLKSPSWMWISPGGTTRYITKGPGPGGSFLFQKISFIYLSSAGLALHCCRGFSLVEVSGGGSCCRAQALGHTGFSSWGTRAR